VVAQRSRATGADVMDKMKEGPGAATATTPIEIPLIEVDSHTGHTLEPEWKRLPIAPDHILYPVLVGLALFPILMGDAGHHLADDMPDEDTHPFFPDHFWPYPIIAVMMLVAVGLLAAFVQKNLQLEASADPRAVTIPRPDWYFLFLFQFLKLGNELVFSLVIPPIVIGALLLFPFIDAGFGPRMAKRLGWKSWPVPGRNVITGTVFVVGLGIVAVLTLWALAGPQFCLPWFVNSPVCGA
jgi:quinol-cytochrome oxidoreductase complex cytochrome b subunit